MNTGVFNHSKFNKIELKRLFSNNTHNSRPNRSLKIPRNQGILFHHCDIWTNIQSDPDSRDEN